MKSLLTVFRYTFLRYIRDPEATFYLVMLPIVLILLLGLALGNAFGPRNFRAVPVAVVIEDSGPAANEFRSYISDDEFFGIVSVTWAESVADAGVMMDRGEISVIVHIPEDFTRNAMAGQNSEIRIMHRPDAVVAPAVVQAVIGEFVTGANVTYALLSTAGGVVEYESIAPIYDDSTVSLSGRRPEAFDFYAVVMLVFSLVLSSSIAIEGIREDLLLPVGFRLGAMPIGRVHQYGGKLLACLVVIIIQAYLLIGATIVLYRVNWGDDPHALFALVFSLAVFATAFGSFLITLLGSGEKAESVITVIAIGSIFLAGGAQYGSQPGSIMRIVRMLLPSYHGQRGFFALIYGRPSGVVPGTIVLFLVTAAVLFVLSLYLGRRRSA